tara:strand:- start:4446 stop:6695 length:2250 start_codon:yes stop_codon:yes gene_type:complete
MLAGEPITQNFNIYIKYCFRELYIMEKNEFILELLHELSYRSDEGYPILSKQSHIYLISEILDEWGFSDIKNELIQNLTEAGEEKKYKSPALNKVVKYTDREGNKKEGLVGSLLRLAKDQPGRIAAEAALPADGTPEREKINNELGGEGQPNRNIEKEKEDKADVEAGAGEAPATEEPPQPGVFAGQGGDSYRAGLSKDDPAYEKSKNDETTLSNIQKKNNESIDSFIEKGFTNSDGAPGSPGSMLNEIISIKSATDVLNSKEEFDYESQLQSNIDKLKGSGLAKDNDGDNPASGVTKSEAKNVADKYGVSIGVASKSIIAVRAAQSKCNHIKQSIINNNNIENAVSVPFFGDKGGLKAQEDFITGIEGNVFLGNTIIDKDEAISIIKSGGGGENPSDTAIFVKNEDTGDVHMVFFSDKDNVNAIVAQSSIVAETQFKKNKIDDFVKSQNLTQEQADRIKLVMDDSIQQYQKLEKDLDDVVNGPVKHLQNIETSRLVDLTKTLSKGANADKYWKGDKNTKGVAQVMTTSKKHIAYLPDGHSNPPTELEMMSGFISYVNDENTQLTKIEQRIITDLSNQTDGPKLGAQIGEIRKKTVDADINLIKLLDKESVSIDGKQVGIGTLLEAESVAEKLHLGMMFGGEGVYKDSAAFYQESGGTKVDKSAMERCLPFKDKNDMLSHFEVGEESEITKRGGDTITGGSKIVYAITKDGNRYPIGEKKQRSKTGELGKLQTVYNYHPDIQRCFKKNG